MYDATILSKTIRHLRCLSNLTRLDFGKAIGCSKDAVYKWESGKLAPSIEKLCVICNIFNVSVETMLDPRGEFAKEE